MMRITTTHRYFLYLSKPIFLFTLLFGTNFSVIADHAKADEYRIGVLAKRGQEVTKKRWNSTASYLSEKMPGKTFTLVPLSFDDLNANVENHQVDFLLTNSGMFVDLSFNNKLFALATLKRNILGKPFTEFGSVMFTRKDQTEISHFKDLIDQDIAAVDSGSLGGWIAALRELDSIGVNQNNFHSLEFLGTHDAVVYAVENKVVDVGIVRTDTLERMQAEGKVSLTDFNILPPIKSIEIDNNINFPLVRSTRLYPEWPFASLSHVPEEIAEAVSAALITMPADSQAAINSKILGWTIPKNYRKVDLAFGQLKLGYYATISSYSIMDVLVKYWQYILIGILGIAFLIINTLYIVSVNRKLGKTEKELRFQATHDALTGLPNRIMFYELAARFLHIALRDQRKCIILFLDLDRFKQVNDTHGHDVGDLMLKEVSRRMSNMLRDNDIIARIGGDEFLVMLSNIESVKSFESIMERLIEVVTQPLTTDAGLTIDVGCSIGAAHYPQHGSQLKDLIKKADHALYKAKDRGRGCYVIHGQK